MTIRGRALEQPTCAAAADGFDFSNYLDICKVCISANADVAGLGVCGIPSLSFRNLWLSEPLA